MSGPRGDGQGGAKPAGSGAKPKNTAWDRAVKDLPTRPAENEQARTPTVVVRADRALRLGREIRKLERQMGQVHLYEPDRTEPPSQPELDALPPLAPSPLPPPSADDDRSHGRGLLLIGLSGLVVALGILVAATLRRGKGEIAIEPMPQGPPAVAAGPLPPGESPAVRPPRGSPAAPTPEPGPEVDELPAGETPVPAGAERPDPSEPPPEGELPAHAVAEADADPTPHAAGGPGPAGAPVPSAGARAMAAAAPTALPDHAAAPSAPPAPAVAPAAAVVAPSPADAELPAAGPSAAPVEPRRPAAPRVRITVQTRPATATALVDGMPVDGSLELPRGPERHVLVVQAPGHRTVTRAFDARRPTTLRVTLPRLPPERPTAQPAADKPPLGEAPLVAARPEAPSPPPAEPARPATAPDGGVAARPDAGVASEAFIAIVGAVDGARIQVDTRAVGVTPLPRIAVRPGRHTIWAEADGHEIFMRAVEVKPGATLQVKVELQKIETIEDL